MSPIETRAKKRKKVHEMHHVSIIHRFLQKVIWKKRWEHFYYHIVNPNFDCITQEKPIFPYFYLDNNDKESVTRFGATTFSEYLYCSEIFKHPVTRKNIKRDKIIQLDWITNGKGLLVNLYDKQFSSQIKVEPSSNNHAYIPSNNYELVYTITQILNEHFDKIMDECSFTGIVRRMDTTVYNRDDALFEEDNWQAIEHNIYLLLHNRDISNHISQWFVQVFDAFNLAITKPYIYDNQYLFWAKQRMLSIVQETQEQCHDNLYTELRDILLLNSCHSTIINSTNNDEYKNNGDDDEDEESKEIDYPDEGDTTSVETREDDDRRIIIHTFPIYNSDGNNDDDDDNSVDEFVNDTSSEEEDKDGNEYPMENV